MSVKTVILVVSALAAAATARSQVLLSGALAYSSASDGSLAGYPGSQQVWNTGSYANPDGDGAADLWFSDGGFSGTFVNGPNDPDVAISFSLDAGKHTFYLHASSVEPFSHYGLNLFFNGDLVGPGISVFAPLNLSGTDPIPPFAAVDASASSLRHDGLDFVPAAGSLVFSDGLVQVKLTEFSWSDPSVENSDRVGYFDTAPDGILDFTARFTLEVTPVPEPASLGAAAVMLVLGAIASRHARQKILSRRMP